MKILSKALPPYPAHIQSLKMMEEIQAPMCRQLKYYQQNNHYYCNS